MAQQQGLLGPVRPQHGAGYQILDGLLGGWVSYPERVRTAQAQRQATMGAGQDLLSMFARPEATAQDPGQALNAGSNPAMQAPASVPDISNASVLQRILRAKMMGAPGADMALEALKANQPSLTNVNGVMVNTKDAGQAGKRVGVNLSNVNGFQVDQQDPNNAGKFMPKVPDGAVPLYDQAGNVVAVKNLDGTVQAMAEQAGGTAAAEARGKAPYTADNRQAPNGAPVYGTLADRIGGQGGGMMGQAPDDAAYAGKTAETTAKLYDGIQTAGSQASSKIAKFRQIDGLLGNFEGGKLSPAGLEIASAMNSLGFKMDPKWSNAQAADAAGKQLVLEANGGSLGTGFSNADRDFLQGTVPGLLQSAGGRKQVIEAGIKKAQRDQQIATFARQWQQKAGRLDKPDKNGKTFFDYMDDFAEANPLFGKR